MKCGKKKDGIVLWGWVIRRGKHENQIVKRFRCVPPFEATARQFLVVQLKTLRRAYLPYKYVIHWKVRGVDNKVVRRVLLAERNFL